MRTALHILRAAAIVTYTLALGPLCCVVALVDRSGVVPIWIARLWIRWILRSCRVDVGVRGLGRLDVARPSLYMANHSSVFDVAALLFALPGPLRFVAKRELVRVPIFGWAMALSGHLIVDRGNRAKVVESLDRGIALLRSGRSLVVFPEGSRSPDGELRTFKNGGFQMAIGAGVPIVPVAIRSDRLLEAGSFWRIDGGRISIAFGDRIPTDGLEPVDRPALKKVVRGAIMAGLSEG